MAKSKAPSGLSISRNGTDFNCSWKIGESDYGDGQYFNYRFRTTTTSADAPYSGASVGVDDTSKTISYNPANYYPAVSSLLRFVDFKVRGNKAATSEGNLDWSDWAVKTLEILVPNKPTDVEFTPDSELANKGSFSWRVDSDSSSAKIFSQVQWQSAFVYGVGTPKWGTGDLAYSSGTSSNTSGSVSFTETRSPTTSQSYTRWFRIRSSGPRGSTEWVTVKHVYGIPNKATNVSGTARVDAGNSNTNVTATFNADQSSGAKPVDKVVVQYAFAVPDANLTCPSGSGVSWQDGVTLADIAGKQTVQFIIDDVLDEDECLFIRVNAHYGTLTTAGDPVLILKGKLKAPSIVSVTASDQTAFVEVQHNSTVPDSFIGITYIAPETSTQIIGILEHNETTLNFHFPTAPVGSNFYFSAREYQGNKWLMYTTVTGINYYAVNPINMVSDETIDQGVVPIVPTISVSGDQEQTSSAIVTWDWTWSNAEGITISWAKSPNAWESTDAPETFNVESIRRAVLYVTSLDVGETYYFRARYFIESTNLTGPWSEIIEFISPSKPGQPVLYESNPVILEGETVNISWSYYSEDALDQGEFQLFGTKVSSGEEVGDPIILLFGNTAKTDVDLSLEHISGMLSVQPGDSVKLVVRVKSSGGLWSDDSNAIYLTYANPLVIGGWSGSLIPYRTPDDREVLALRGMPLVIETSSMSDSDTVEFYVLRKDDYHLARPNGKSYDGYKGEVVAYSTVPGNSTIVIGVDQLYGTFDDGGAYNFQLIQRDVYGRSVSITREFEVHWAHQPTIPTATVTCYSNSMVDVINVAQPTGYVVGDAFDVYRLSSDDPELIIQNGQYGIDYVDPFPAFNKGSGYRIVNKTSTGDYVTVNGTFSWIDKLDDYIEYHRLVIDFDRNRVVLPYNLVFDDTWEKDFKKTDYLGGSTVGDWNPAISFESSVATVLIPEMDENSIRMAHELAEYPGICHVRTPGGNSFAADVQLTENRTYDALVYEYNLTIKKVDGEGFDGMTLAEWEELGNTLS